MIIWHPLEGAGTSICTVDFDWYPSLSICGGEGFWRCTLYSLGETNWQLCHRIHFPLPCPVDLSSQATACPRYAWAPKRKPARCTAEPDELFHGGTTSVSRHYGNSFDKKWSPCFAVKKGPRCRKVFLDEFDLIFLPSLWFKSWDVLPLSYRSLSIICGHLDMLQKDIEHLNRTNFNMFHVSNIQPFSSHFGAHLEGTPPHHVATTPRELQVLDRCTNDLHPQWSNEQPFCRCSPACQWMNLMDGSKELHCQMTWQTNGAIGEANCTNPQAGKKSTHLGRHKRWSPQMQNFVYHWPKGTNNRRTLVHSLKLT